MLRPSGPFGLQVSCKESQMQCGKYSDPWNLLLAPLSVQPEATGEDGSNHLC